MSIKEKKDFSDVEYRFSFALTINDLENGGSDIIIVKRDFKEKLAYLNNNLESDILKEFFNTEFLGKQTDDESLKIKPEILRELINIYKKLNPTLMLECECE